MIKKNLKYLGKLLLQNQINNKVKSSSISLSIQIILMNGSNISSKIVKSSNKLNKFMK